MVETSIVLSLMLPAALLVYTAFKFSDGHSSMRMLFTSASLVFALGVPFTAYRFADLNGYSSIADYLLYFELGIIMVFVFFVFYLIWLYLKATSKVVSGSSNEFDDDEL